MNEFDFNFFSGLDTILVKEICHNHYCLSKVGEDVAWLYLRKKKGKWIQSFNGQYCTTHPVFLEKFLKGKDEWIAETILLGEL